MIADFRYALRQLMRSPGFSLTAILTLGLGIGATAAVYGVIRSVLLAPLPYFEPQRLVGLALTFPQERPNAEQTGGSAEFVRDNTKEFSSVAVMDDGASAANLAVEGGNAAQVEALRVSEGYFRTLGASPDMGHTFTTEEDHPGGGRSTVLSHGLWVREFGSDPSIVGRAVRINEETYTVIGVMPASFAVTAETTEGVFGTPDLWTPLQLSSKDPGYDGDNYQMIGRLRPGVSMAQVQQHLNALIHPFYEKFPEYKNWFDKGHRLHEFRVWNLQDVLVSRVRRSLLLVLAAVLSVLLVACINLAGLMIARSMRRSREMAVRSALGARRAQLVRLVLCEALLLALGGGVHGIAVARVCVELLMHAAPLAVPAVAAMPSMVALSGAVLGIALLATAVFAFAPVLFLLRWKGRPPRLGGPSLGETISHARISRTLIVVQVGMAMVLLSTASVLLGTFEKLRSIPSGVEPKQLTVFQVALKGKPYADTRKSGQFVSSVLDRLRREPGVREAAAVNGLPLDRGLNMGGCPVNSPDKHQVIEFRAVTPGYFRTMGIALLAGRDIANSDDAAGDKVILISAAAARKYWPGRSAIGESFRVGNEANWRIIGVVADTHEHSLVKTGEAVLYAPMAQLSDEFTGILNGWFPTTFAIRTAAWVDVAAMAQRAVWSADAQIPVARLATMDSVIDATIEEPRFFSYLSTGFSLFALALTVIGLFGLLSYQVAQRTREIGVRMALGADRADILRGILVRGLRMVFIGIVAGLVGVWYVRPVLMHLLSDQGIKEEASHNLVMNEPLAMSAAALAIVFATLAASWLPARRAAAVEPMQALRTE